MELVMLSLLLRWPATAPKVEEDPFITGGSKGSCEGYLD